MERLKEVTDLVTALRLKPQDVVEYWQSNGLLNNGVVNSQPNQSKEEKQYSEDYVKQVINIIIINELQVPKEDVIETARFREDLGCDSMDIINMVMILEKELRCVVPDKEVETIKTVQDAYRIVTDIVVKK